MLKEYDVFIEHDHGMGCYLIPAKNKRDLFAQLRRNFPDDIGADACATDPETSDQFPINWGAGS